MNVYALSTQEKQDLLITDAIPVFGRWLGNLLACVLPNVKEKVRDAIKDVASSFDAHDQYEWIESAFFSPDPLAGGVTAFSARKFTFGEQDVRCSNLLELSDCLGMNTVAKDLMHVTYWLHAEASFAATIEKICRMSFLDPIRALSIMIGQSEVAVRRQLVSGSSLMESCALRLDLTGSSLEKILFLQPWVWVAINGAGGQCLPMYKNFYRWNPEIDHPLKEFEHVIDQIGPACSILESALSKSETGVNILVHGLKNSGKSCLARAMAADCASEYREVCESPFGPISDELSRFAPIIGHLVAQRKSSDRNLIVINDFDAILKAALNEDGNSQHQTFLGCHFGQKHEDFRHVCEQWIENLLSGNKSPTIWVMRDASGLSELMLSYFSWRIALPRLPVEKSIPQFGNDMPEDVRNSVLSTCVQGDLWGPTFLRTTAKTLGLLDVKDMEAAQDLVARSVRSIKSVVGADSIGVTAGRFNNGFSESFTNIKGGLSIDRIASSIKRIPSQSICLYGPPGTGKTEFAAQLAKAVGRPLLQKRCSDVFDKYIGETEKLARAMFVEASSKNAVLFLDEADAMLSNRMATDHHHIRSTTNEILTSMERFNGLFICATNLMEQMDPAALRRFSLKIGFEYLTHEQRWLLFCRDTGMPADDHQTGNYWVRLASLKQLTPGDYSTVRKQAVLFEETSPEFFMVKLEEEHKLKTGRSGLATIGFVN